MAERKCIDCGADLPPQRAGRLRRRCVPCAKVRLKETNAFHSAMNYQRTKADPAKYAIRNARRRRGDA